MENLLAIVGDNMSLTSDVMLLATNGFTSFVACL